MRREDERMAVKVVMPKLGLTMTEGVLTRWLVQNGTGVKKGQPIFEVETDKVVNEAQADADGVLRIVVDAGATVPVMGLVGYILAPGEEMPEAGFLVAPTSEAALPAEGAEEKAVTTGVERQAARPMASPAAKRRARELELDITQVAGTGEGGRITLADVEALAAPAQSAVEEDRAPAKEVRASPLAKRVARQAGLGPLPSSVVLSALAAGGPELILKSSPDLETIARELHMQYVGDVGLE